MQLRDYLNQRGRGAGCAIARALGVKPVMVSQWASGAKRIPFERCTAIEAATEGVVRRWDLRPGDWHHHWPELVGMPGAPEVTPREVAHG